MARLWQLGLLLMLAPMAHAQTQVQHDYWPGREKAIPHVSGDEQWSGTYKNWKDSAAVRKSMAAGMMSRDINFKDFRWLEKSFDGEMKVEMGREVFHRKSANGRSCATCHGENGEKLKGWYARQPKFSTKAKRVIVAPTQIGMCAKEHLGEEWPENTRNNSLLDLYVAYLSDGREVDIDVKSGPMKDAYEKGRDLFFKRTGHFHFACASCHTGVTTQSYLRGQRPSTFFGDAAHYPIYHFPFRLPGDDVEDIFTLQHQIKSCQMLSRMLTGIEGSPSMTAIEVFLKASANGFNMSIPTQEYNMSTGYLLREDR